MRKGLLAIALFSIVINGCTFYPGGLPPELQQPAVYYYGNAPFNPGYPYSSWYVEQSQPNVIFFIGNDGRHHRHNYRR